MSYKDFEDLKKLYGGAKGASFERSGTAQNYLPVQQTPTKGAGWGKTALRYGFNALNSIASFGQGAVTASPLGMLFTGLGTKLGGGTFTEGAKMAWKSGIETVKKGSFSEGLEAGGLGGPKSTGGKLALDILADPTLFVSGWGKMLGGTAKGIKAVAKGEKVIGRLGKFAPELTKLGKLPTGFSLFKDAEGLKTINKLAETDKSLFQWLGKSDQMVDKTSDLYKTVKAAEDSMGTTARLLNKSAPFLQKVGKGVEKIMPKGKMVDSLKVIFGEQTYKAFQKSGRLEQFGQFFHDDTLAKYGKVTPETLRRNVEEGSKWRDMLQRTPEGRVKNWEQFSDLSTELEDIAPAYTVESIGNGKAHNVKLDDVENMSKEKIKQIEEFQQKAHDAGYNISLKPNKGNLVDPTTGKKIQSKFIRPKQLRNKVSQAVSKTSEVENKLKPKTMDMKVKVNRVAKPVEETKVVVNKVSQSGNVIDMTKTKKVPVKKISPKDVVESKIAKAKANAQNTLSVLREKPKTIAQFRKDMRTAGSTATNEEIRTMYKKYRAEFGQAKNLYAKDMTKAKTEIGKLTQKQSVLVAKENKAIVAKAKKLNQTPESVILDIVKKAKVSKEAAYDAVKVAIGSSPKSMTDDIIKIAKSDIPEAEKVQKVKKIIVPISDIGPKNKLKTKDMGIGFNRTPKDIKAPRAAEVIEGAEETAGTRSVVYSPVFEQEKSKLAKFLTGAKQTERDMAIQRINKLSETLGRITGGDEKKVNEVYTEIGKRMKEMQEASRASKDVPVIGNLLHVMTGGEGLLGPMRYLDMPNSELNKIGDKLGIRNLAYVVKSSFITDWASQGLPNIGTWLRSKNKVADWLARARNTIRFEVNPMFRAAQWTEVGTNTWMHGFAKDPLLDVFNDRLNAIRIVKQAGKSSAIQDADEVSKFYGEALTLEPGYDRWHMQTVGRKFVQEQADRLAQGTVFQNYENIKKFLNDTITQDGKLSFEEGVKKIDDLVAERKISTNQALLDLNKKNQDKIQIALAIIGEANYHGEMMLDSIAKMSHIRGGLERSVNYVFFPTSYVWRMVKNLASVSTKAGLQGNTGLKLIGAAQRNAKDYIEKTYGEGTEILPDTTWVLEQLVPLGLTGVGASADPLLRWIYASLGMDVDARKPNLVKSYITPVRQYSDLNYAYKEIRQAIEGKSAISDTKGIKVYVSAENYDEIIKQIPWKVLPLDKNSKEYKDIQNKLKMADTFTRMKYAKTRRKKRPVVDVRNRINQINKSFKPKKLT